MKFSKKFIKASNELCSFQKHVNAPYLRKSFLIDFVPENAKVSICGLGFYELYINGVNVTKGPLAPYIGNPDHICYYDCYDITEYLQKGKNAVGVILGNGFRNPFGGFIWEFDKSTHVGPCCLAMSLTAHGEGKEFAMLADESFKTHPSPVTFDDIRMGCRYDARLEIPGWNLADFDDSCWKSALWCEAPKGEMRLCQAEPIHVRREIYPVSVKYFDKLPFAHNDTSPNSPADPVTVREKVHVFDFGVNTAGVTRLHIKGHPGQKITIRHGEYLVGDNFDMLTTMSRRPGEREIYYEYGQCDVYICGGGDEYFTPRFKYDGFRYAYVDGLEPEQLLQDTLVCLEMTSDVEQRAGFSSSDDSLERLYNMTLQSDRSNFFYFPTDCPHREKNGWTGDISVSAEQLILNFDARKSLVQWLANVRASQTDEGAIPCIVPDGGWSSGIRLAGPAWDAVIVNLPYYLYKYDGDISVITDNAEMIKRYLHYLESKRNERGLFAFGLGDWADPFRHDVGYIASPLEVTSSANAYDIAKKAADLFEAAGLTEEVNYAKKLATETRRAFRNHLIDDSLTVEGNCQTSQAIAIGVGIFDDCELEKASMKLVEIIHGNEDVTACGILGMRYIFHVLAQAGQIDLAYKLILSESRSCYGYWLKNGFTSLCESFRDLNFGFVDSRNHHFFGDISSFLIQKIVGIQLNPAFNDCDGFVIEPGFPEELNSAEGHFVHSRGRLSCKWERENSCIRVVVGVPKGMKGIFKADGKATALSEGENVIVLSI